MTENLFYAGVITMALLWLVGLINFSSVDTAVYLVLSVVMVLGANSVVRSLAQRSER